MIEILNICLHQNSIFIKFLKILKIHKIFCENPRIIFVLFYDVHKENMFTINLEDGREKFGPDQFSRFDVYWIQTDRQTDKQTDKPNLYIDNEDDFYI